MGGGPFPPIMALEMDLSAYRLALSLHPYYFSFLQPMREGAEPLTQAFFDPFLFPHLTFKSTHGLSSPLTN